MRLSLKHRGPTLSRSLAVLCLSLSGPVALAGDSAYPEVEVGPSFTSRGELVQPTGFRSWIFLGSPLTPHALNGGEAGFPEFHNVYVEPAAHRHYMRTGRWPEGTMMVKELQLTKPGTYVDGSREEVSGRGYFPHTPNGLDVSVKDSNRFSGTAGWGFFNFGHHPPPYAKAAEVAPKAACAACHMSSAHEDMVFSGFYHQLRPLPVSPD